MNSSDPTENPSASGFLRGFRLAPAILLLALLCLFPPQLLASGLKLDFTNNHYTQGWIPVYGNLLGNTMVNVPDVGGSGYDFTFDHVACWDNNVPTQPLTRSGFYNFGRLANEHTFTLSGLNPGQSVRLFACAAWDGNAAGGHVVFGDSGAEGVKAQTIGSPGLNPTLDNLTYIGTAEADENGTVTGSLHGRDGVGTDSEGQVGAFVFLPTRTITASAGPNGSISPSGEISVPGGEEQTFTIAADNGHHIQDVLVDGQSVGAVASYTFTDVDADHTISASFAVSTVSYTITASAGANGSISPGGAVNAHAGVNMPFTIVPDPGYHIADVLVNGVSIGPVASHTFVSVAANHTISASFAIDTYTIEAGAGPNGTITPGGTTSWNHGDGAFFTITPDPGYYIAELLVDGIPVEPYDTYYFDDIQADRTITATFDNRTRLHLDFTTPGGAFAHGWTPVHGNYLAHTELAAAYDIDGLGYHFTFSHVATYDNGRAWEPMTRSGFYNFGRTGGLHTAHTFTLTGLNARQTVHLYASAAWDGNAHGGYIVFGDTGPAGVRAQTIGEPGLYPVLGNMTLIGTAVSDSTGKVTGSLHGAGGVDSATEGQVGGFVFIIEEGGTPADDPYKDWATSPPNNLSGADELPAADPDFDGVPNLLEFALNGSPVSGASTGLSFGKPAAVDTVPDVMTLTIAVRNGAAFSPAGNRMKSAPVDGLVYTVEASSDLVNWGGLAVAEVTGADAAAIQSGFPTPDPGWTYKTFRIAGAADGKGFLRVAVD